MPIRFIDTNFYKSPFIRSLEGSLKGLYNFIILEASGAGIWAVDLEVASIYTGFKYSTKQFKEAFIDTGKAVDLGDGKFFFPDFIEHQYPNGLQPNNPAHKNFIKELQKYNLIDNELRPIEGASKGLQSSLSNSNSNSIGNSNGNETVMYYRKFAHLKITEEEVSKLLDDGFLMPQIDEVLDSIQNYKANKKYTSLYLTAKKWLKKEEKQIPYKNLGTIDKAAQSHEEAKKHLGL